MLKVYDGPLVASSQIWHNIVSYATWKVPLSVNCVLRVILFINGYCTQRKLSLNNTDDNKANQGNLLTRKVMVINAYQ